MAAAAEASSTKVLTGVCRLSYVHAFAPYAAQENQTPKYSVVLLIPKEDTVTLNKIRNAQQAALQKGKDSKFKGSIPKNWTDTLHDGDEEADLDKNPEYEGHWYMTVSNPQKPGVIDKDKNIIDDPTQLYSGCFARVVINAFAFNQQGNKGVSFGLNHIQKVREGDPLGSVTRAEDEFDEFDDGASLL